MKKNVITTIVFCFIIALAIVIPMIIPNSNAYEIHFENVDEVTFSASSVGKTYAVGTSINNSHIKLVYYPWFNILSTSQVAEITYPSLDDYGEPIDPISVGDFKKNTNNTDQDIEIMSRYWEVYDYKEEVIDNQTFAVVSLIPTDYPPISDRNNWYVGKIIPNHTFITNVETVNYYTEKTSYIYEGQVHYKGDHICSNNYQSYYGYNYFNPEYYSGYCNGEVLGEYQCWEIVRITRDGNGYVEEVDLYGSSCTAVAQVDSTVKIIWEDNNNAAKKRPYELSVSSSSGTNIKVDRYDKWIASLYNLPKYNSNNQVINYSWDANTPNKYELVSKVTNNNITTITYRYTPEKVAVNGTVTWDDEDDFDGLRPDKVTVTLTGSDGTTKTQEVSSSNNWAFNFDDLLKYTTNDSLITYTITQNTVNDYTTDVTKVGTSGNTTTYRIDNKHVPERITITGNVIWDDEDNRDGVRPERVTVTLTCSDGTKITKEVEPNWTFEFKDLPTIKNGVEVTYELTSSDVNDYQGPTIDKTNDNQYNITYVHKPERMTIIIDNIWEDDDNSYGKRPDKLIIYLFADNEPLKDENNQPLSCELNEENNWSCSFENQLKYKDGKIIKYNISDVEVPEYEEGVKGVSEDYDNNTVKIQLKHSYSELEPEPQNQEDQEQEEPQPEEPKQEEPEPSPITSTGITIIAAFILSLIIFIVLVKKYKTRTN